MASNNLVNALRGLQAALKTQSFTGVPTAQWGWQAPAVDRDDLVSLAEIIIETIEAVDWTGAASDVNAKFSNLANKVMLATTHNAPNLGGGREATDAIVALLTSVDVQVKASMTLEQIKSSTTLSIATRRSLNVTLERLNNAVSQIAAVERKAEAIEKAYDTAESIDVIIDDMNRAAAYVKQFSAESVGMKTEAEAAVARILQLNQLIQSQGEKADESMKRIDATFRASTSFGLAGSFKDRAERLERSVLIWLLALLGSLTIAGLIGHDRFAAILKAVGTNPDWKVVSLNALLATLALSPAVWMAWVATKQVGQRFRLSEDYAYKASLSTAYEGYRNEAVVLDKRFQAQLFGTALSRLDELPIRLVSGEIHGSPFQELVERSGVALPTIEPLPGLLDRVLAIVGLQRKRPPSAVEPKKVETEPAESAEA